MVTQQTANQPRRLRVFLCHSQGDKPAVRALHERLLQDGFQPWLDEVDLMPGVKFRDTIAQAVQSSEVVLVCLSKASVTKEGFVQNEIHQALEVAKEKPEGTIFLIPARLEECQVPNRLSAYQWVDLWQSNGYSKLCQSLQIRADHLGILHQTRPRPALAIAPKLLCIVLQKFRTYGAAFNLDCEIVNEGAEPLYIHRLAARLTDPYNASFLFQWNLFYKTVAGVQSKDSDPLPIALAPRERKMMGIQFVAPLSINKYNWTEGKYSFDLLGWVAAEQQMGTPDFVAPGEMFVDMRASLDLRKWREDYDALKDPHNAIGIPVRISDALR